MWGRVKRELSLARRRHTPEQMIAKLRETGVAIAGRGTAAEAVRRIGATGQPFYRWRSGNGGPAIDRASRLKPLKSGNSRPQRAAADLTLDNQTRREASGAYSWALHAAAGLSTAPATLLQVSQQGGAMPRRPPVLTISAWSKAASCCGDATLSVLCYNGNREGQLTRIGDSPNDRSSGAS